MDLYPTSDRQRRINRFGLGMFLNGAGFAALGGELARHISSDTPWTTAHTLTAIGGIATELVGLRLAVNSDPNRTQ